MYCLSYMELHNSLLSSVFNWDEMKRQAEKNWYKIKRLKDRHKTLEEKN